MYKEEKKAIEILKDWILRFATVSNLRNAIITSLNLIEKQDKEIIEKCEKIDSLERDIGEYILEKEKQDKMIDYMADDIMLESNMFSNFDMCENEKENCAYDCKISCTDKVKEYFRKKVEEDAKN